VRGSEGVGDTREQMPHHAAPLREVRVGEGEQHLSRHRVLRAQVVTVGVEDVAQGSVLGRHHPLVAEAQVAPRVEGAGVA
jgi:hypothetical protein